MKKIIFLLAAQLAICGLFAQSGVKNKANIKVMPNTYLAVKGAMDYTNIAGAKTVIRGGMRVGGIMTNLQGNDGIIINNNADLLQNTNSVSATVRQDISANTWYLISNPVAAFNFANGFTGIYVYEYIENSTASSNSWLNITSGIMQTDRGYLIQSPSSKTINFTGNLNNGDMVYTLVHTPALGAGAGFNLVGNPYSCAIDWSVGAGFDKTNTTGTAYVWVDGSSQYGNTNGTVFTAPMTSHKIPSCQGFTVKTTTNGSTFTIRNGSKALDIVTPLYKQKLNNLLRIRLSGEGKMDETVVYYESEASQSYDLGIDSDKFFGTETNLYTKSEDAYSLAINATSDIEQSIPLCFSSDVAGNYTLLINEFNFSTDNIYLEDKRTGIIEQLSENKEYSFSYQPEDNAERFMLHFKSVPMSVNDTEKETVNILTSKNAVSILNAKNSQVEIFDLFGKKFYQNKTQSTYEKITLNQAGIYIVKVLKNNKVITKKIIIQ